MAELYQTQSGGILDFFNTFSGGALSRMSRSIALGVMPYITASIVVQLGATLYGPLAALKKEGETGRKKLNQYTRYLHRLLITRSRAISSPSAWKAAGDPAGHQRGRRARACCSRWRRTVSLVGGTMFLMWIGEQITSRGIGNGVSLIIMAGIVARLPQARWPAVRRRPDRLAERGAGRRHRRAGRRAWSCSSASWSAPSAGC